MPNNNEKMRGLMRGMHPELQDPQPELDGARGGVSEEQWQRAQQKMDEVLGKHPQLQNNKSAEETYADQMSPEDLQGLSNDFEQKQQIPVMDNAQLRALQKLRGSGQGPQGF